MIYIKQQCEMCRKRQEMRKRGDEKEEEKEETGNKVEMESVNSL